eukprot:3817293-Amphidinium_carterae.1
MHEVSMAEVLAEVEALEASRRFNKIDTPDFGAQALGVTMDCHTKPMQPQMASFPIPTGTCRDRGHADLQTPPPRSSSKPSAEFEFFTPFSNWMCRWIYAAKNRKEPRT